MANYVQDSSLIQLDFQVDNVFKRTELSIYKKLLPIRHMILEWKPPILNILVNCQLANMLQVTVLKYVQGLSLPLLDHHTLLTGNGDGILHFSSINDALKNAACLMDIKTTTVRPWTTTRHHDMPIIPVPGTPVYDYMGKYDLDSDFLMLTYNTRIHQYQNLLDLKKFASKFKCLLNFKIFGEE